MRVAKPYNIIDEIFAKYKYCGTLITKFVRTLKKTILRADLIVPKY